MRVVVTKTKALEIFKDNPFKVALITSKIPEGGLTSLYVMGNMVDLCTGPHLPNAGYIKAFKCEKNSSSNWLAKAENEPLQRIYAIAFPSNQELDAHLKMLVEIEKRKHKNIGGHQQLFMFHQLSPGSCFFFPHGAKIYNKLIAIIRKQYISCGYDEVISPNIYNMDLWHISGHALKYKENMFLIDIENQEFGVKPMNCPGHCLMFDSQTRSYKDLPIRYADFGVLHRNELSGALHGLTRVRRF